MGVEPSRSCGFDHPLELTSFIGRREEIAKIDELMSRERLVSLVGSGGCGKTRLATRAAAQVAERFEDGACFVDLSAAVSAIDVDRTLAAALGVVEVAGADLRESITAHLSQMHLLLVVDNCEQVVEAAASAVQDLLEGCPRVSVLATSRQPLRVPGERALRVPSLATSSDDADVVPDALALFIDRAQAVNPEFEFGTDSRAAVEDICTRLDGIPLAIELAAARVSLLTPEEIAAGLSDRFRVVGSGARTALPRQQTLFGSISWSYDLLTERERALLCRASVFVAGFDLTAAQAVCADPPLARQEVVASLASLVDHSLVVAEQRAGRTRFRLLETIRQFAAELLEESGEIPLVRDRHLDHFLRVTEEAWRIARQDQAEALALINTERENCYAALDWSLRGGRVDDGLRLCEDLWGYWASQGRFVEGREQCEAAVLSAREGADGAALAGALFALSWLEELHGDYITAYEHAEQGLALAREVGDRRREGRCLTRLGLTQAALDYAVGVPKLTEAIEIARGTRDDLMLIACLAQLAWFELVAEGPAAARSTATEAMETAMARNDVVLGAQTAATLALLEGAAGNITESEAFAELARDYCARTGNTYYASIAWCISAWACHARGDTAGARRAFDSAEDLLPPGPNFASAASHSYQAELLLHEGDLAAAVTAARTAAETAFTFGPWVGQMWRMQALTVLALALEGLGDRAGSRHAIGEAVVLARSGQLTLSADSTLTVAADMARRDGEPPDAAQLAREALRLAKQAEMYAAAADALDLVARLSIEAGDDVVGVRLAGAAAAHRRRAGTRTRWIQPIGDLLAVARDRLDGDSFDRTQAAGEQMSVAEAIELVLRGRGPHRRANRAGWSSLTPAESKVVELVAEGLSNTDIANQLYVSRRTVDAHLVHVYTKLDLHSRAELIAATLRRRGT